jgi:hypothetical protein
MVNGENMGKIGLDGRELALLMALHDEGNARTIRYWEWEPLGSLQRKGLVCRASYSGWWDDPGYISGRSHVFLHPVPGGGFRLTPKGIHHLGAWDRPAPEMQKNARDN